MKVAMLVCGIVLGMAIASGLRDFFGDYALAQTKPPTYRVLGTMSDTTMERELNEASRQGCRPTLGFGSGHSEAMLVLECP